MSLKGLYALADQFEKKLMKISDDAQLSEGEDTDSLFFGTGFVKNAFGEAIKSPTGAVSKYLYDKATQLQKSTAFDLKITSIPRKGASWILSVTPPSLKTDVMRLLDIEFQKLRHVSMASVQANADKKAKAGAGDGLTLDVAYVNVDM